MKFNFYTAFAVIASSVSAITLVKSDAELNAGLPEGIGMPKIAA